MQILPDFGRPYLIDSLTAPMIITHYWVLSGPMVDFTLLPILYLEETQGPTIKLLIEGCELDVPTSWHMLVTDGDTYIIDSVSVSALAGNPFKAVIFTPSDTNVRIADVTVLDYNAKNSVVHPLIQKGQMMCHPVGPKTTNGKTVELCCIIGPHDLQRHLTNLAIGDLLC